MTSMNNLLNQSWIHSHEEDKDDEIVYRPANFAFPPSRGRYGFSLRPDGTAVLMGPGPVDRSDEQPGTWGMEGDDQLVLKGKAGDTQVLRVTSATPDKLVVQRSR